MPRALSPHTQDAVQEPHRGYVGSCRRLCRPAVEVSHGVLRAARDIADEESWRHAIHTSSGRML